MKYFALAITLSLFSTSSHAVARILARCATRDGQYTVSVAESMGIIKKRSQYVAAAIKDADNNVVASYFIDVVGGEHNNYGGIKYVDKATGGENFVLTAPEPAEKGSKLDASIAILEMESRVVATDMQCSAFNRQLPGR